MTNSTASESWSRTASASRLPPTPCPRATASWAGCAPHHRRSWCATFSTELDTLPARPTYISDSPPRSAIFLPLTVAETTIGTLSIQSPEPGAFDEDHLRLLAILANQSAAALHNARLYATAQQRLNALLAVSEVGRKLTSILDLNQLLAQVVELIRRGSATTTCSSSWSNTAASAPTFRPAADMR